MHIRVFLYQIMSITDRNRYQDLKFCIISTRDGKVFIKAFVPNTFGANQHMFNTCITNITKLGVQLHTST